MKRKVFTIDLEKILYPISINQPAGVSLRYDQVYDDIKEARREDDLNLEQGIYKTELKHADWILVEKLCLELLETRSKDLQLVVWLTEAWLHLYGFVGLKNGFSLILALCENFWELMYPTIEDGDLEFRLSIIDWIDDKLCIKMKLLNITSPTIDDAGILSYADWEEACMLDVLEKKDPHAFKEKESQGKPTILRFQNSFFLTPNQYVLETKQLLGEINSLCLKIEQFLDKECGKQFSGLIKIKSITNTISKLLDSFGFNKTETSTPLNSEKRSNIIIETEETEEIEEETEIQNTPRRGPIRSRAEAYRRLNEVADYLMLTEPHSPTPYLLKRAVAWGGMSLHEVFGEIIRDRKEMEELNKLLRFSISDLRDD